MSATVIETVVSSDRLFHLPEELPVGCAVKITVEPIVRDGLAEHYQPRTDIGRLALAARRAYIERGGKLLNQDEVNDEVRRRRGGVPDE